MITLRQIQFALAVERHHHFKKAAEECHVSQSALSLGVAELEKNLGVTIFERSNKQVVITPLGKDLLNRAQKIYLDTQQLVQSAHAGRDSLSFGMRLGFIPTIAPFLLPKALPLIRQQYPNFDFTVTEDTSSRLLKEVQIGDLDAAILALPFDIGNLESIEFASENFNLIVHENHPLAQETCVNNAQLSDTKLLLLGEGHCLRDHILQVCQMNSRIDNSEFRNASLNTLIQLTANDMGATLVPDIALDQMKQYAAIKTIPLDEPGPHRRLAIITRENYSRMQDLSTLANLFAQSLSI